MAKLSIGVTTTVTTYAMKLRIAKLRKLNHLPTHRRMTRTRTHTSSDAPGNAWWFGPGCMRYLLSLLPCRPPVHYFLWFFRSLLPSMMPYEVFGLLSALFSITALVIFLALWTPTYEYVPKHLKCPPDKLCFTQFIPVLPTALSTQVQTFIQGLNMTQWCNCHGMMCYHSLSSHRKHLFSLCWCHHGSLIGSIPCYHKPPTIKQWHHRNRLLALASFHDNKDDDQLVFDADLYLIAVNNCASCTMMNQESDLFDTITVHWDILGIGSVQAVKMGTFYLRLQNNQGMVHEHLIPDSYYSPDMPIWLLSPQHWTQVNCHLNAHSDTNADHITLEWDDHIHTIPLSASNIGSSVQPPVTNQPILSFKLLLLSVLLTLAASKLI